MIRVVVNPAHHDYAVVLGLAPNQRAKVAIDEADSPHGPWTEIPRVAGWILPAKRFIKPRVIVTETGEASGGAHATVVPVPPMAC